MARLNTGFRRAEESPGFLLWKAANVLQRLHAACLRGLGVTPTQFSLLACLLYLAERGPVTSSRIVRHSGLDKMLVSDVVRTLERKRLISRVRHPTDGRSWLIESTSKGERATNAAIREVERLDAEFFARIANLRGLRASLVLLSRAGGRARVPAG